MVNKNSKKIKEQVLNYLLTLSFILGIVIMIVSIVFISRLVLSDSSSPFTEHVKNTQKLLNDIDEVESKNISPSFNLNNIKSRFNLSKKHNLININNYNNLIIPTNLAYYNIKKNKSIISFKLNFQIENIDNYYYIKIKNISKLKNRDLILLNETNKDKTFYKPYVFISFEKKNNQINLYDLENEEIKTINNKKKVIGKIIYIKNEND